MKMKPGRVSTTTLRGGGGSSSTSTSTCAGGGGGAATSTSTVALGGGGGGGPTTRARPSTRHPPPRPSNVADSTKLLTKRFIWDSSWSPIPRANVRPDRRPNITTSSPSVRVRVAVAFTPHRAVCLDTAATLKVNSPPGAGGSCASIAPHAPTERLGSSRLPGGLRREHHRLRRLERRCVRG